MSRTKMLYSHRNDIINKMLLPGLGQSVELPVQLPLIQQLAQRHQPHLGLRSVEQRYTIEDQPGKQSTVAYPAVPFFTGASSLKISRLVPRYIASIIAA